MQAKKKAVKPEVVEQNTEDKDAAAAEIAARERRHGVE